MTSQSPEQIPGWAIARACELAKQEPIIEYAFARYIASVEEEPADPLVEALTEAFMRLCWSFDSERDIPVIREELAKRGLRIAPAEWTCPDCGGSGSSQIKRGIELGREDK